MQGRANASHSPAAYLNRHGPVEDALKGATGRSAGPSSTRTGTTSRGQSMRPAPATPSTRPARARFRRRSRARSSRRASRTRFGTRFRSAGMRILARAERLCCSAFFYQFWERYERAASLESKPSKQRVGICVRANLPVETGGNDVGLQGEPEKARDKLHEQEAGDLAFARRQFADALDGVLETWTLGAPPRDAVIFACMQSSTT